MSVGTGTSLLLSSVLAIALFSGMQIYRPWLTSTPLHTILGGFLSSVFFVLLLTAIGNLETIYFGPSFQTKLFPEIFISFALSVFGASLVHRACITSCILFCLPAIYFMNKLSQEVYVAPTVAVINPHGKRRKGNF